MSELPGGIQPAQVPEPRDSALGILLRRDGSGRWQVLLGRRSRKARFLPGHLAFPGGRLEPDDRPGEPSRWRRCASREVLEETGMEVGLEAWLEGGERTTPPIFPVRYRTAFLVAECPAGDDPAPTPANPENEDLVWLAPSDAMARYDAGAIAMPPPVVAVLRAMAADPPATRAGAAGLARAVNRLEENAPRIEFIPGIWMLPVHTDTLPPATHTNVYLPWAERFAVIDPGSDRPDEVRRLLKVIGRLREDTGATPAGVLLTHHHQDHVSGAEEVGFHPVQGRGHHGVAETHAGKTVPFHPEVAPVNREGGDQQARHVAGEQHIAHPGSRHPRLLEPEVLKPEPMSPGPFLRPLEVRAEDRPLAPLVAGSERGKERQHRLGRGWARGPVKRHQGRDHGVRLIPHLFG